MEKYALANRTFVQLMKEPRVDSELADEVMYGMKLELLSELDGNWFYVRTHYKYEGYVHGEQLLTCRQMIDNWEESHRIIVYHAYADVMSEPRYRGGTLINMTRGAQLKLEEPDEPEKSSGKYGANEDGWVKVGLCDGRCGYIKEQFIGDYIDSIYEDLYSEEAAAGITPAEFLMKHYGFCEEEFRSRVVTTAMLYLRTQYRWGGKLALGIDCSGLCSMAYMLNGLDIYRDAKIVEGFPIKELPFDEKKPGDLVFFPGHVAMYIGDGKYIHSTGRNGSDGVVINSFIEGDELFRKDLLDIVISAGTIF